MDRTGGHEYIQQELEKVFPKLRKAQGDFLLYKGSSGTSKKLAKIRMGKEGNFKQRVSCPL